MISNDLPYSTFLPFGSLLRTEGPYTIRPGVAYAVTHRRDGVLSQRPLTVGVVVRAGDLFYVHRASLTASSRRTDPSLFALPQAGASLDYKELARVFDLRAHPLSMFPDRKDFIEDDLGVSAVPISILRDIKSAMPKDFQAVLQYIVDGCNALIIRPRVIEVTQRRLQPRALTQQSHSLHCPHCNKGYQRQKCLDKHIMKVHGLSGRERLLMPPASVDLSSVYEDFFFTRLPPKVKNIKDEPMSPVHGHVRDDSMLTPPAYVDLSSVYDVGEVFSLTLGGNEHFAIESDVRRLDGSDDEPADELSPKRPKMEMKVPDVMQIPSATDATVPPDPLTCSAKKIAKKAANRGARGKGAEKNATQEAAEKGVAEKALENILSDEVIVRKMVSFDLTVGCRVQVLWKMAHEKSFQKTTCTVKRLPKGLENRWCVRYDNYSHDEYLPSEYTDVRIFELEVTKK